MDKRPTHKDFKKDALKMTKVAEEYGALEAEFEELKKVIIRARKIKERIEKKKTWFLKISREEV